jgi:hypothetical protein
MKKLYSLFVLCIAWGIAGFAQTNSFFSIDTLDMIQMYGSLSTTQSITNENPILAPGTAIIEGVPNNVTVTQTGNLSLVSSIQIDFPSDFEVLNGGFLDAYISDMQFKSIYYNLNTDLSSEYVVVDKPSIHFVFIAKSLATLSCVVYDEFKNQENAATLQCPKLGINFLKIDVQNLSHGFHVLQITGSDNVKQYLRFHKQ